MTVYVCMDCHEYERCDPVFIASSEQEAREWLGRQIPAERGHYYEIHEMVVGSDDSGTLLNI